MPAETEKIFRPRADIEAAVRGFTAADWARLHKVGKLYAYGTGWDFEDLLQEAQLRTLRGTRNCPTDVEVMKHLIDTHVRQIVASNIAVNGLSLRYTDASPANLAASRYTAGPRSR